MNLFKRFFITIACFALAFSAFDKSIHADGAPELSSVKAAILTEKETGQVLYEKNADERLPMASVTKIMVLLIAAEEIKSGNLSFTDSAVCSEHAGSMDGSVIWLEAGEVMEIGDLIKSIVIASANDACVMLAEHIAGSESAFVERMNKRAAELGMTNTNFINCVGYDDPEHYSTARDIAKMASELRKYDYYDEFLLTRLDSVRTGTKTETQLLNTNKLITSYNGITGLKTGTTDNAGYCLCATAVRREMELVGVVLGAQTEDERFSSAEALLDYGFNDFETVTLRPDTAELLEVNVEGGVKKTVDTRFSGTSDVILPKGSAGLIEYHYSRTESVSAPVEQGQLLGFVTMTSGETVVGTAKIVAAEAVDALDFKRCMSEILKRLFTF
ncbi:MAG: D-alanyl-D-alanine carboxypeptidase [Ruminiclostridium sp.]|nr:D-alanyl-D-alanine carboxypeptidase [Ruminiclostridium sp.]